MAGPQLGYYYPEIVGEMDLHGGGIDARGIASTGAGPYVFIGRGQDFSWSLTSASNDLIDIYVESLCGNSDTQYLFEGKCKQMTTTNAGVLKGAGGAPDQPIVFNETVHGPVIGYATVGGQKVAISRKRSTRGREALSLLAFNDLNSNRVDSAQDVPPVDPAARAHVQRLLRRRPRHRDVLDRPPADPAEERRPEPAAARHGPQRVAAASSPAKDHPQQINPRNGYILNWNNRPGAATSAPPTTTGATGRSTASSCSTRSRRSSARGRTTSCRS